MSILPDKWEERVCRRVPRRWGVLSTSISVFHEPTVFRVSLHSGSKNFDPDGEPPGVGEWWGAGDGRTAAREALHAVPSRPATRASGPSLKDVHVEPVGAPPPLHTEVASSPALRFRVRRRSCPRLGATQLPDLPSVSSSAPMTVSAPREVRVGTVKVLEPG